MFRDNISSVCLAWRREIVSRETKHGTNCPVDLIKTFSTVFSFSARLSISDEEQHLPGVIIRQDRPV